MTRAIVSGTLHKAAEERTSKIEALTIIADHDLNGAGLRAASEAADRWQTAGRETHVFQRETPGDFNDAFREIER